MRIGINGLLLTGRSGYRQTGVSRYIDRLTHALPAAMPGAEFVLYAGRDVDAPAGFRMRTTAVPVDKPAVRVAWERFALPVLTRRDHLSLFHGPVNAIPGMLPCPSVVTIHDLALLRWPEQVTAQRFQYLSRAIRDAARRADRVIAVSEATRDDIVELLGISADKIAVTHLGVDRHFQLPSADAIAEFKRRHRLERPYLLTVGTLEPRKNLPRIILAFSAIRDEVPHELVVVGPEGWRTETFKDAAAEQQQSDRFRMTGFVPDDELPLWYAAADVLVFPSLYEGFGLPIVEAMACGTPVVTSNGSSMREIAGDAAVLVDPISADSIACGIMSLLSDSERRREFVARGLSRAAEFTWERTAAATAAVYREVLG